MSDLKLLTVEEVAEKLRVSRCMVFQFLKQGLPSVKLGKRRLVSQEEMEKWVREKMKKEGEDGDDD